MKNRRKITLILLFLLIILVTGMCGYMILLHVDAVDALYMTVITISTVGYGEVGVMTDAAKLFSIFIIFAGLSAVGYGVSSLVAYFFEGELRAAWRKKRMENKIQELKNHYIVCGAGEVGRTVIKCLKEHRSSFVVIEENEKQVEELAQADILTIPGDATHEDTLQKAGIANAKGIVCALPTDSENVFTALTARQMNADICIVSKAVEPTSHNKLIKAGANHTISPNEIGGQRIAALLLRPSVISFLDVITRAGDITLDLAEVVIPPQSGLTDKKLAEAKIPERTGLIVLALRRGDSKKFKFNPGSGEIIRVGDTMVVLGTAEQVGTLEILVNQ
ncbi:MAG: potassium channel protein [Clostridiales bacterium]|nr:potassium channel protein [Clostridiales bacterium]